MPIHKESLKTEGNVPNILFGVTHAGKSRSRRPRRIGVQEHIRSWIRKNSDGLPLEN